MRVSGALLLLFVLGGCTSVKMVQRDGCWVRRTEKRLLGTVSEEVGPCARPATAFVENDPLTRLVQECVSRADYRWQMRALAAWDRHEPWPAQLTESSVLQQCIDDSARGVLGETVALKERNAALQHRLDEVIADQKALRQRTDRERDELVHRSEQERKELFGRADQERKELLAIQSKLGDELGAAARKVPRPAPAIATATATTSEGRSSTQQASDSKTQPATLAIAPPTTPDASSAPVRPAPRGRKFARPAATPSSPRHEPAARRSDSGLPACDPTKTSAASPPSVPPAQVAEAAREKGGTGSTSTR